MFILVVYFVQSFVLISVEKYYVSTHINIEHVKSVCRRRHRIKNARQHAVLEEKNISLCTIRV